MAEDIQNYENEAELALYKEYREVMGGFKYAVDTERRVYLANHVDLQILNEGKDVFYELALEDAWVWDVFRADKFIKSARILTFRDVNIEEL